MKVFKKIIRILLNKYILILLVFIILVGFLDKNNTLRTLKTLREIKKLEQTKSYYQNEIARTKKETNNLMTNQKSLEKFARENYHMKKDDEEIIFIEVREPEKK